MYLNTISLEDWAPGQPNERWCSVKVVERYEFDGRPRLKVEILDGPEAGRVVSGLSPSNLRTANESVQSTPAHEFVGEGRIETEE